MKKILIILFFIFYFFDSYAQNIIKYDNAGNRIQRTVPYHYYYYNYNTITWPWPSDCDCIVVTTPQPYPSLTGIWIRALSVERSFFWDVTDLLNASTSVPRGTITIKHLTDPLKFQKYSIGGNSTSTGDNYYYMGLPRLLEMGSSPLIDGDTIYVTYTIN